MRVGTWLEAFTVKRWSANTEHRVLKREAFVVLRRARIPSTFAETIEVDDAALRRGDRWQADIVFLATDARLHACV